MRFLLITFLFVPGLLRSQSIELMGGQEGLFGDAQWLRFLDSRNIGSVFSRARGLVDYQGNTDVFLGVYLNATSPSGIGGTVLGRIATSGAGGEAGIHYFRARETWMLYALASAALDNEFGASWFSILRFSPAISEKWKFYGSLELYSAFSGKGHVFSVQRIRAGVDRAGYQFGLAANISEFTGLPGARDNLGLFVRKSF